MAPAPWPLSLKPTAGFLASARAPRLRSFSSGCRRRPSLRAGPKRFLWCLPTLRSRGRRCTAPRRTTCSSTTAGSRATRTSSTFVLRARPQLPTGFWSCSPRRASMRVWSESVGLTTGRSFRCCSCTPTPASRCSSCRFFRRSRRKSTSRWAARWRRWPPRACC
eukprot:Amastigsp_a3274_27.p4 type:complete len:164 gc:universal Amastigsp_a3274_27:187-678(+)